MLKGGFPIKSLVVVFALFLMALWGINASSLKLKDATIQDSEGNTRRIETPFSKEPSGNNSEYVYCGIINYYPWSQDWVHIVPDDRLDYIEVNNNRISLSSIDDSKFSDWRNGFHLNLGAYLKYGKNIIKAKITNLGERYGLSISSSDRDIKKNIYISLLIYFIISFILYHVSRLLQFGKGVTLLLLICLPIYIVVFVFAIHKSSLVFDEAVLKDSAGIIEKVEMPYLESSSPRTKEMVFTAIIECHPWTQNWIHIYPDDHLDYITVNGEPASLEGINPAKLDDWANGFDFNLGKYLKPSKNIVRIKVSDHGGLGGLKLSNSSKDIKRDILSGFLALPFLVIIYRVLRLLRFHRAILCILLLGLAVKIAYFLGTNYDQRGYDVSAHIGYIEYIVNNKSLPDRGGWITHHPPTYYILAAIYYNLIHLGDLFPKTFVYRALQVFSLVAFVAYEVVCILLFQRLLLRPCTTVNGRCLGLTEDKTTIQSSYSRSCSQSVLFLVTSLFVFWPSNIIHSIRISNEIFLYLFYALALFFLVSWVQTRKDRNFYKAVIFAVLALITKSNGIVILTMLGIAFIAYWIRVKERWIHLKKAVMLLVLTAVGGIITFGPGIIEKVRNPNSFFLVRSAVWLNSNLYVGNNMKNYVYFDVRSFVTEPFTSPIDDKFGRQYFWNYLLKTALFGEFQYDKEINRTLGILMSIIFLAMLVYTMGAMVMMRRIHLRTWYLIFLNAALLVIALLFLRVQIPAVCHGDFRLISPVLISFCLFYGFSLDQSMQKNYVILTCIGYSLAYVMVLSSILFFLGLVF